jgi:hypothetical protein
MGIAAKSYKENFTVHGNVKSLTELLTTKPVLNITLTAPYFFVAPCVMVQLFTAL